MPQVSKRQDKRRLFMGDKSPKSVNKKAAQKQSKNDAANQKKQEAVAARSAAGKNR